jgi:acyl-coenzyme A synthetase/AMP-(fatty) acid ligase
MSGEFPILRTPNDYELHESFIARYLGWLRENGYGDFKTYHELLRQVGALEAYLRAVGVRPGDRVAGMVTNGPEAIVAMLAAASLGAIWSSASPDFGATGSPLLADDFDWVYADVKHDVLLASIAGGTDVVSAFLGANPLLPIRRGEIYRQVDALEEIADSIVVGQPWQGDSRVVLMVVMSAGHELDAQLIEKIKMSIREHASPRHVPAKIIEVDEIPYTHSGKKVEIAVGKVLRGEQVDNRDALANPGALDKISVIADLWN